MIEKDKFRILNYVKKEEYTGSMQGMRYMLKKITVEDEAKLEVIIWPEPFGYAQTPEQKKQRICFAFSEEGLEQAVDWMNEQLEVQSALWSLV